MQTMTVNRPLQTDDRLQSREKMAWDLQRESYDRAQVPRYGVRAQPTGHLLNVLFAAEAKGCSATAAMIRRELRERGEAMPGWRT